MVSPQAVGAFGRYLLALAVFFDTPFGCVVPGAYSAHMFPLAYSLMVTIALTTEATKWVGHPLPHLVGTEYSHRYLLWYLPFEGYLHLRGGEFVLPLASFRRGDVGQAEQQIYPEVEGEPGDDCPSFCGRCIDFLDVQIAVP